MCRSADRFRIAFMFRCTYTDFYILILCLCFVVVLFFIFFFFHLLYLCLFLRQIKRRQKQHNDGSSDKASNMGEIIYIG